MAGKFTIPKDIDFQFQIQVKDKDSFLPRDLTTMTSAIFEVFEYDKLTSVFTHALVVNDVSDGLLDGSLTPIETSLLKPWMAPTADRGYVKSQYHATITLQFSDAVDLSVYIDEIYVTPTGV